LALVVGNEFLPEAKSITVCLAAQYPEFKQRGGIDTSNDIDKVYANE
jgi:hypothetical protein